MSLSADSDPMKTTLRPLLPLALFGAGCLSSFSQGPGASPASAFDTSPEGPAAVATLASVDWATAREASAPGAYDLRFPASSGRPSALFTLPDVPLADRLGLAVDVTNTGGTPIRLFGDLNHDMWMRGYVTVPAGQRATLFILARLKSSGEWPAIGPDDAPGFPQMHGVPGPKMFQWTGLDATRVAHDLKLFVVAAPESASIRIEDVRPFGSSKPPDLAGFFPFIDRYGQFSHKDWPGKIHADADLAANLKAESEDLARHPGPAEWDRFGGWAAGPQLRGSGHFRVDKIDGRWWLVDPDGRLFWSNGVGVVGFNLSSTKVEGRERFFADPAPKGDFLSRNLSLKYGPTWPDASRDRILTRLRSWGLNTMGGASDPAIIARHRTAYTVLLWTGGRGAPPIDPDSSAWAAHMRGILTEAAHGLANDPWCLGFFVDNEIHLSTDPAWYERYYRQVSAVAKEVMPNILYLGSRLDYHDWPESAPYRREVVRVAARYCDVVSFNFYTFTLDDFAMPEGVDRPALIGEFHMGALDRGLFHTGLRGTIDQNQRAEAYRLYLTSARRNPAIVGAHWFQLYDESTTGRRDGENYQIGLIDIGDTPYPETIGAVRDTGYRLYEIREGKDRAAP
jgi:hypothetical protein